MPELRIRSSGAPPAMGRYRRREPENTVLYQLVREHLETFLVRREEQGHPVPRFIAPRSLSGRVLTVPFPLRFRMAYDAPFTSEMLRVFVRAVVDLPPFVVPLAMLDQPPRPSGGAERKQAAWASSLVLEAGIPANCAV